MTLKEKAIERELQQCRLRLMALTGHSYVVQAYPLGEVDYHRVIEDCCKLWNVPVAKVLQRSRKAHIVAMRQVLVLAFSIRFPHLTMSKVASLLKYGDHTTVIHHRATIQRRIETQDEDFLKVLKPVKPIVYEFKNLPVYEV